MVFDREDGYFPGAPIPLGTLVIFHSVGLPSGRSLFSPDSPERMIGGTIGAGMGNVIVERVCTAGDASSPILSNNSGPVTLFNAVPEPGALGLPVVLAPLLGRRR